MIEPQGIYILWLRDLKRYFRARSRVIGSLGMPFFFLAFLGTGFRRAEIPALEGTSYIDFLTPGVVSMVILFSSMFSGISIVWDRQFGFLREILVAPVSRTTVALGRIFGGATTSLLQGLLMMVVSLIIGFNPEPSGIIYSIIFMLLTSIAFTGLGITFSTFMKDVHGFQLIINFFIFPVFFLSGAIFPLTEFPEWVRLLALLNPLSYSVDGMRWSLIGYNEMNPFVDMAVPLIFSVFMIFIASYFFRRMET
ncbi:MAG TPA: multidrug ABC transporter permease [Archaeoglobaceae archaeon]|nr:multidrug ABC transporter permease [Archaeoglobaceae archaeon]